MLKHQNDGKSLALGKMQILKEKTLQGRNNPWQKKGIYCNKVCCFAGFVKRISEIIEDKIQWSYRSPKISKESTLRQSVQQQITVRYSCGKLLKTIAYGATEPPLSKSNQKKSTFGKDDTIHYSGRQSTIHATVPMANFSKVAATFGKSKCNDQKQTTSCPDS